MAKKKKSPSKEKALKILKDGEVYGKKLTERQRKFFTAIAKIKDPETPKEIKPIKFNRTNSSKKLAYGGPLKSVGSQMPVASPIANPITSDDYDIERAIQLGYGADKTGHWGSRDYITGDVLKLQGHPTLPLSYMGDMLGGYEWTKNEEGRYRSMPNKFQARSSYFKYGGKMLQNGGGVGGDPPGVVYVDSASDPRFKAYQDSSNLYKSGIKNTIDYTELVTKDPGLKKYQTINKFNELPEVLKHKFSNSIKPLMYIYNNYTYTAKQEIPDLTQYTWLSGIYKKPVINVKVKNPSGVSNNSSGYNRFTPNPNVVNDDVKNEQRILKDAGLYDGIVDGIEGPKTQAAREAYALANPQQVAQQTATQPDYSGMKRMTREEYEKYKLKNTQPKKQGIGIPTPTPGPGQVSNVPAGTIYKAFKYGGVVGGPGKKVQSSWMNAPQQQVKVPFVQQPIAQQQMLVNQKSNPYKSAYAAWKSSKLDQDSKYKILANSIKEDDEGEYKLDPMYLERRLTVNAMAGYPEYSLSTLSPEEQNKIKTILPDAPLRVYTEKEQIAREKEERRGKSNYVPYTVPYLFDKNIYGPSYIAEEAHGYKHHNEENSIKEFVRDYIKYPYISTGKGTWGKSGQRANYYNPDHFEFDTHSNVEPVLDAYIHGVIDKEDIPKSIDSWRLANKLYFGKGKGLEENLFLIPEILKTNGQTLNSLQHRVLSELARKINPNSSSDWSDVKLTLEKFYDYHSNKPKPFKHGGRIQNTNNENMKKKYKDTEEYGLGGDIFSGAASGASAGSMFGPWGMAAGALIGGVAGYANGQERENMENRDKKVGEAMPSWSYNPYTPTFPMGGQMPMANAEVEGGEVVATPGGQVASMDGPSHEQGGIDIQAPEGSIVFSDRIKSSSGKTYAEEADKIKNKMKKYEKIMSDKSSTSLSRKTAEMMSRKISAELEALYNDQESFKSANGIGQPEQQFWYGGGIYGGGEGGGSAYGAGNGPNPPLGKSYYNPLRDMNMYDNPYSSINYTPPEAGPMDFFGQHKSSEYPTVLNPSVAPRAGDTTFNGPLPPSGNKAAPGVGGSTLGSDIAYGAASYAPSIYNLGQGLFGKADYVDPREYMSSSFYNPVNMSMDQARNDAYAASNIGKRNMYAMSPSQLMSGSIASQNALGRALGDISQKELAFNLTEQGKAREYNEQINQYNLGMKAKISDYNKQALAAKQKHLAEATQGISDIAQSRKLMEAQADRDYQRMTLLQQMFPHFDISPDGTLIPKVQGGGMTEEDRALYIKGKRINRTGGR